MTIKEKENASRRSPSLVRVVCSVISQIIRHIVNQGILFAIQVTSFAEVDQLVWRGATETHQLVRCSLLLGNRSLQGCGRRIELDSK